MTEPIIITVEGGLVQEIKNIPPGVEIQVRDYDVEGEGTDVDEDGRQYVLSFFLPQKGVG